MSAKRAVLFIVLGLWAGLVALSFWAPAQIGGPGNLEIGLAKLDLFARYQFAALGVAVLSAALGVLWRGAGAWMRLTGFAPLAVTAAAILGLVIVGMVLSERNAPEMPPDRPQTAPAAGAMTDPATETD